MATANDLVNSMLETVNEVTEMNTEYRICPEIEANATIVKWDFQHGTGKTSGKPWYTLTFTYDIDSQEARDEVKRDKVLVAGNSIFLQFADNGQLDADNNQELARMAKLFDISPSGLSTKAFFESFIGQYCSVSVKHEAFTTKNGEAATRANVVAVGQAS